MSRQRITPGGTIDVVTADELVRMIPRPEQHTRVRTTATVPLDANGNNTRGVDIYKIPVGYDFELRRLSFSLTGNVPTDPNTGFFSLQAAGKFCAILRSGQLLEYSQPTYGPNLQIPGTQTWGDEQGPYYRNGEVFGIAVTLASATVANQNLSVYLEGILRRPSEHTDA